MIRPHRTHLALASALLSLAPLAARADVEVPYGDVPAPAQDTARVVSSTPILQRVATPQTVCSDRPVTVQPQKSGTGAVVGAIAGAALGNSLGRGSGQAAATALGLVGGALVGDRLEDSPSPRSDTIRQCSQQTGYHQVVVGYQVVYEYAGKRFRTQTGRDPGASIAIQVGPGEAPQAFVEPLAAPTAAATTYEPAPYAVYPAVPVYPAYPVYPAPYPRGYYPGGPVIQVSPFVYGDYYGHRHWR